MNQSLIKRLLSITLILVASTSLALAMKAFYVRTENILLVYVGAVLLINILTKSLWMGMVSSLICVMVFNFLFTEPFYTFVIADANYFISMAIFVVVTMIVNTLSSSLQRQIEISMIGEKRTKLLNSINKSLLNAHQAEDIIQMIQSSLYDMLQRDVFVWMRIKNNAMVFPESINLDNHTEKIEFCISHHVMCGKDTLAFTNAKYRYLPFESNQDHTINGAIVVFVENVPLTNKDEAFIEAVISSLLIVCERETLSSEKELTLVKMEKEKFKSSLLRSISHDIKTPLTSITTGTSLLLDGSDTLTHDDRKRLLTDIHNESLYLADFVNNLLNMTKIDAQRLSIEKHHVIVDDLLSEVMKAVQTRLSSHKLTIHKSKDVIFVDADHQLLIQVLINLIDNSLKHTHETSSIIIDYTVKNNALYFQVIDNGGGLDESKLNHLFEDFVSVKVGIADKSRGTGLGLYICSAIIKAHGGEITAFNNDIGGATFQFYIPYVETEGGVL